MLLFCKQHFNYISSAKSPDFAAPMLVDSVYRKSETSSIKLRSLETAKSSNIYRAFPWPTAKKEIKTCCCFVNSILTIPDDRYTGNFQRLLYGH